MFRGISLFIAYLIFITPMFLPFLFKKELVVRAIESDDASDMFGIIYGGNIMLIVILWLISFIFNNSAVIYGLFDFVLLVASILKIYSLTPEDCEVKTWTK